MKGNEFYIGIDGLQWPKNKHEMSELCWRLRHGEVSEGDKVVAAGIIDSYIALINKNTKSRNQIASLLKHILNQ